MILCCVMSLSHFDVMLNFNPIIDLNYNRLLIDLFSVVKEDPFIIKCFLWLKKQSLILMLFVDFFVIDNIMIGKKMPWLIILVADCSLLLKKVHSSCYIVST